MIPIWHFFGPDDLYIGNYGLELEFYGWCSFTLHLLPRFVEWGYKTEPTQFDDTLHVFSLGPFIEFDFVWFRS